MNLYGGTVAGDTAARYPRERSSARTAAAASAKDSFCLKTGTPNPAGLGLRVYGLWYV